MNTKVTRHSFYRGKTQFERFTEHAPLCVEDSGHDLCNCTRTVTDRPVGEPENVVQVITFEEIFGKYQMKLDMEIGGTTSTCDQNAVMFTIRWPRAEGKPPRAFSDDKDEHAYFWFVREDNCQVEVTGTGDNGDVDCTLGSVLFGNRVDVSTFFNGALPSRVVDLTKISPEDVWLHYTMFGEAWARIEDNWTVGRLHNLQRLATRIRDDVSSRNVVTRSVAEVRASVDDSDAAKWLVRDAFDTIYKLLDVFQDSILRQEMVRLSEEIKKKAMAQREDK